MPEQAGHYGKDSGRNASSRRVLLMPCAIPQPLALLTGLCSIKRLLSQVIPARVRHKAASAQKEQVCLQGDQVRAELNEHASHVLRSSETSETTDACTCIMIVGKILQLEGAEA